MTTRRRFLLMAGTGVVASCFTLSVASAQTDIPDGSTLVIVRHADREPGSGDVALTKKGQERAKALRETLRHAGISIIVTTKTVRTRQTAKPLAELLNLTPIEVERDKVEQTVRAKLPAAVLVVGHSDTVPDLVSAFGGPAVEASTFDNLFTIIRAGGATRFIHSRYGAPSP